jgi:hypothetical protein
MDPPFSGSGEVRAAAIEHNIGYSGFLPYCTLCNVTEQGSGADPHFFLPDFQTGKTQPKVAAQDWYGSVILAETVQEGQVNTVPYLT